MLKTEERCEADAAPAVRTAAGIIVQPLFKQGHEVVCSIDAGNYMKGGNISLPQGHYTLTFNLIDGEPRDLNFKEDDHQGNCMAFWSSQTDCPNNAMNEYDPRLENGRRLLVDVDVNGATPQAVHYRLNFDNNCYFDPIIIHE